MTRAELAFLSQAHAVALTAMIAPETGKVPFSAAHALEAAARADMPSFAASCTRFCEQISVRGDSLHAHQMASFHAGRELRDAVGSAMAFVSVDADRVDIHG